MNNNVWSQYVQTTEELYCSRDLRFTDSNKDLWLKAIGVKSGQNILEVGCAGGTFCHKIKRYVPDVRITGLDIDTGHIEYAKAKAAELGLDCTFVNADATAMPFADNTFDLCYSHTVVEHIPHEPFFGEQYRVLKPGGRVAVLSVRTRLGVKNIHHYTLCDDEKALLEKTLIEKVWGKSDGFDKEHNIGAFEMDEHEYPKELEKAGFHDVNVDFFTVVDYAPDNASVSDEIAIKQINSERVGWLACVKKAINRSPDALTEQEESTLLNLINDRFDKRIKRYKDGERLWDFMTCTILAASGKKF